MSGCGDYDRYYHTKMPKISVVVPIYGVEKYIERCARSLFSQTLDDVELIFVNDCTKDASIEMLQKVMAECQPSNVKIINHSANQGAPMARMTGIMAANGDFIVCCDGDDWAEPDYCEILYRTAIESGADMAICGFNFADDSEKHAMSWGDTSVYEDSKMAFRHILAERLPINLWCRIVRREIAQSPEIRLPVAFYADDWAVVVQWVFFSKKIAYVSTPLYNYYVGNSSQSRSPDPQNIKKNCLQKKENFILISKWLAERSSLCQFRQELVSVKFLTKAVLFPVIDCPDCKYLWRRVFRCVNICVLTNRYITRREKSEHFRYLLGGVYPVLIRIVHFFIKNHDAV